MVLFYGCLLHTSCFSFLLTVGRPLPRRMNPERASKINDTTKASTARSRDPRLPAFADESISPPVVSGDLEIVATIHWSADSYCSS